MVTKADICLVALDLDGTLLTSKGELPDLGASLLTKAAAKGVHVVLATTRHSANTLRFYHALSLNSPFISGNGSQVWASAAGPLWAEHHIAEEVARSIAELADQEGWELATTVGEMIYCRQRPNQPLGLLSPYITIVATNRDGLVGPPLRILTGQVEAIDPLATFCRTQLQGQCTVEVYMKADGITQHSLGVFAPLANKGTAITLVMERLGLTREQVVTIGDNFNDLPMFACSGISVAMANAPEAVKQQATLIAPSNDDEGIAWALQELQIV